MLYYRNNHYFAETDAIDRIVRVLSKEAPPEIEKFRLIAVLERRAAAGIRRAARAGGTQRRRRRTATSSIIRSASGLPAMNKPVLAAAAREIYPRFSWGLYPQIRQALFDPNQPFGVQLLAAAGAGLELAPGLSISGSLEASLYDDFDTTPRQRQPAAACAQRFPEIFHARARPASATWKRTTGSAWRPPSMPRCAPAIWKACSPAPAAKCCGGREGARWALGADIYQVWQRDFDRLFGLQHYHVTTGHVSLYYDSPWYDLNFQLRAGQYLAGDRGFTFQVTRRFSTGVEIGAFFTKTNVSAPAIRRRQLRQGHHHPHPAGLDRAAGDPEPDRHGPAARCSATAARRLLGDATFMRKRRATSEGELLRQNPASWRAGSELLGRW